MLRVVATHFIHEDPQATSQENTQNVAHGEYKFYQCDERGTHEQPHLPAKVTWKDKRNVHYV